MLVDIHLIFQDVARAARSNDIYDVEVVAVIESRFGFAVVQFKTKRPTLLRVYVPPSASAILAGISIVLNASILDAHQSSGLRGASAPRGRSAARTTSAA